MNDRMTEWQTEGQLRGGAAVIVVEGTERSQQNSPSARVARAPRSLSNARLSKNIPTYQNFVPKYQKYVPKYQNYVPKYHNYVPKYQNIDLPQYWIFEKNLHIV